MNFAMHDVWPPMVFTIGEGGVMPRHVLIRSSFIHPSDKIVFPLAGSLGAEEQLALHMRCTATLGGAFYPDDGVS